MAFTVTGLRNITGGRLLSGPSERVLSGGICTDSRKVAPHSVFFALSGEKFDGNQFAAEASRKGASAVVVSTPVADADASCAVILVPDVLTALQKTAMWWRERLTGLIVVGITGSSGKTSTKDLVKSVLARSFRVTATQGNLNNHIGLPLSVLKAEPSDQVAVWEMGMNHAGELAPLCEIAKPRIGIISSIGSAHIEFLGSREAIAEEKCTLPRSLPEDGSMIYPADCEFAALIEQSTKARHIPVGIGQGMVRADNLIADEKGTTFSLVIEDFCNLPVRLPLHGRHMVSNALLAAAAGWVMGMKAEDIAHGLETAELTGGRLNCYTRNGIGVVDDSYNANPESMVAALETVGSMICPGRKWAVLGKMGELGGFASEAHNRAGKVAFDSGFDAIVSVGPGAAGITDAAKAKDAASARIVRHFDSKDEASAWLRNEVQPGDLVLFKGSRSAGMDEIINTIFSTTTTL